MFRSLFLAVSILAAVVPAAANAVEQVLYEIPLEMNRNDELDRAMLVIVGEKVSIEEGKPLDTYPLEQGQRADLLIFLDAGDDALNVTDTPSFRKEGVAMADVLNFVMVPTSNRKGALNIITANGFGNTINTTETLTIIYRNGQFVVGGWAQDWSNWREDLSLHCSVNYLAGKAVKRKNMGKDRRLKGAFKPIPLAEWDITATPQVCAEE